MKKYKLRGEFGVTEENGTPIKELGVNLYLNVEGIPQHRVMDMLNQFSYGFTNLMETENSRIERGFVELNNQLMKEGGMWDYGKQV